MARHRTRRENSYSRTWELSIPWHAIVRTRQRFGVQDKNEAINFIRTALFGDKNLFGAAFVPRYQWHMYKDRGHQFRMPPRDDGQRMYVNCIEWKGSWHNVVMIVDQHVDGGKTLVVKTLWSRQENVKGIWSYE